MGYLKLQEWQSGSKWWYVNWDYNTVTKPEQTKWWYLWKLTGLSIDKYITLLKTYGAEDFVFNKEKNYLGYSFSSKEKAHKFVLYINKLSRQGNWN